jgi:two-component system response regulator
MSPVDVLVVDDSDADAELALLALRRVAPQMTTLRLTDGDQAIQYLLRRGLYSQQPFDLPRLLILDFEMPVLSGLQTLAALRANSTTRDLPIVMLSCADHPLAVERSYELGVSRYLLKPRDFTGYCDQMRRLAAAWLYENQPSKPLSTSARASWLRGWASRLRAQASSNRGYCDEAATD